MARTNISSSENCDLISSMPDPILHRILGLLKTREAVQTCVLSKRWQHLWTSLPSLDFDSREFTALEVPEYESEEEESSVERVPDPQRARDSARFARFVNKVLRRRKPLNLDVFRLSYGALDSANALLKKWVVYVVQHNPRVVHLAFLQLPPPFLLHPLYTCTSLEELSLHHCETALLKFTRRAVVNLPNLKRLSIHNALLTKNELKDLLSGCPVLQCLRLQQCEMQEPEDKNNTYLLRSKWFINLFDQVENRRQLTDLEFALRISLRKHVGNLVQMQAKIDHESLQHLTIVNGNIPLISAPNLLTFCYISSEPIATLNMPSLTYALLELENPMVGDWLGLASFLSGLINVNTLELQVPWAQLEEKVELPQLPIFQKMHQLSIGAFCMCSGFCLVAWILGKVPNLTKLRLLQQCECSCFGGEVEVNTSPWIDTSLRAAISQCKNLELVEVKYSRSDRTVRQLVDTLVDGTKELQNVQIVLSKY